MFTSKLKTCFLEVEGALWWVLIFTPQCRRLMSESYFSGRPSRWTKEEVTGLKLIPLRERVHFSTLILFYLQSSVQRFSCIHLDAASCHKWIIIPLWFAFLLFTAPTTCRVEATVGICCYVLWRGFVVVCCFSCQQILLVCVCVCFLFVHIYILQIVSIETNGHGQLMVSLLWRVS